MFCGIDIGSRTIEVVLFDGVEVVQTRIVDTGPRPRENARAAFREAMSAAGVEKGGVKVVATGYGRNYFEEADRVASEILCHASGVSYFFPKARTVIDIGGQDSKLISLGKDGRVVNFAMNDRCAAGTGKFLEMVSLTLGVPLEAMGEIAREDGECSEISSMCAVFAESEIVGLIQRGTPIEAVLRGVFRSVAKRTLSMTGRVEMHDEVVFTGGVALNGGVKKALETETGQRLLTPPNPQTTGALGAAILASRDGRRDY